MNYRKQLREQGYVVVPDVLTTDEVSEAKRAFYEWKSCIAGMDKIHKKCDPHGIYKHHEVGHQRHAWYVRTRPGVRGVFERIWGTRNLAVSFDGCCWIPSTTKSMKDNFWCHSDQAPSQDGTICYQGLVGLTSNKSKTLVVWRKTHRIHKAFFNAIGRGRSSIKWQRVPNEYEERLKPLRVEVEVPEGAMAVWDSRTFHQNQYGNDSSEERLVQYVCMMPKTCKSYLSSRTKRLKYFREKRTTSHWPYPVKVNGLQPRNYGDQSLAIDYSALPQPHISDMMDLIRPML